MEQVIEMTFDQKGTFQAYYAAEEWCKLREISMGSTCATGPVGLKWGDYYIPKWHNIKKSERNYLDGTLDGDFREGPLRLKITRIPHDKAGMKRPGMPPRECEEAALNVSAVAKSHVRPSHPKTE